MSRTRGFRSRAAEYGSGPGRIKELQSVADRRPVSGTFAELVTLPAETWLLRTLSDHSEFDPFEIGYSYPLSLDFPEV